MQPASSFGPVTSTHNLGVVAFGDSITNGAGEYQWGVPLQSWALWTARGLGLPYTPYAVDGAIAGDVVARQLPAFDATRPTPTGAMTSGASTSARTTSADRSGTRSSSQESSTTCTADCQRAASGAWR